MGEKIKKLFEIIVPNKKILVLGLGLVLFLSLVPLHFAQANIFSDIANYILTLPIRIAALFIAIPLAILAMTVGIAYTIWITILGWLKAIVLTVLIMPDKVEVVKEGWNITQGLANILIILVLVFIGLATILRIKEYETKKLLPTLIGVALLINFSPVIVGFIVDVSNIIANFFLGLGSWESTVTVWSMIGNYFKDVIGIMTNLGDVWSVIGDVIGTTFLGIVLILFFGYSSWIYFLVTALLFVRIIVLWVLMILAPLAFLSYILPASRKLAKEWWQQLVQWSIIAIPIGFFLMLSFKVLEETTQIGGFFNTSGLSASTSAAGIQDTGTGVNFGNFTSRLGDALGTMLVPLVSIVMLHIGYKLSRHHMPAAASQIIGGIEKGMKMFAGTAVVAATGGAAAGLAVKGLGRMARMAQRMEEEAAKLPGGKVWSKPFTKPTVWLTRRVERAASPALLEYQARTRKVPEKELEKIDKMAPPEAEAYIDAKIKMLPGWLKKQRKGQYMARMADKGTLKFASKEFRDEAANWANEIREKENPYYQKEAMAIAKALPATVSEEALVHSKLIGMPNETPEDKAARRKKEQEIREEIKETQRIMEKRIGRENFIIEAALQLKYVTKDDVERNRRAALAEIQRRAALQPGELEQAQRNIAASATFVKELEPEDIKKIIDPDNFATRVGITLGNPRNLQKIQDNFGIKKLKAVIEGMGGLNDATNSPEKLDEFYQINPQMINAILNSPAYRELEIEARKHMRDPQGQPTTNFNAFRKRGELQRASIRTTPSLTEMEQEKIKMEQMLGAEEITVENLQREISKLEALRGKERRRQASNLEKKRKSLQETQTRINMLKAAIKDLNARIKTKKPEPEKKPESKMGEPKTVFGTKGTPMPPPTKIPPTTEEQRKEIYGKHYVPPSERYKHKKPPQAVEKEIKTLEKELAEQEKRFDYLANKERLRTEDIEFNMLKSSIADLKRRIETKKRRIERPPQTPKTPTLRIKQIAEGKKQPAKFSDIDSAIKVLDAEINELKSRKTLSEEERQKLTDYQTRKENFTAYQEIGENNFPAAKELHKKYKVEIPDIKQVFEKEKSQNIPEEDRDVFRIIEIIKIRESNLENLIREMEKLGDTKKAQRFKKELEDIREARSKLEKKNTL